MWPSQESGRKEKEEEKSQIRRGELDGTSSTAISI